MKTFVVGVAFALGLVSPMLAQQDDTIYKPGNGVSPPKLVRRVGPEYPPGALRRRVTGRVFLRCVVDREGMPTSVEIVSSPDEEFTQAALDALKQWRFDPGKKNGEAVLVQVDVEVAFSTPQTLWRRMWQGIVGKGHIP
jgi:TonB family protein